MRVAAFIEKFHQNGDQVINLDAVVLKHNWEPLKKLCTVITDSGVSVPEAEIMTISWKNTNMWGSVECQTFLQHFVEASSRKIVIDEGIYEKPLYKFGPIC